MTQPENAMHELAWKVAENMERWYLNDGMFLLPPVAAQSVNAEAVVVVGGSCLLIARDHAEPLKTGEPRHSGGRPCASTLTWQAGLPTRPTSLSAEPTRHEPRVGRAPALELVANTGLVIRLEREPVLIGRHPACRVRLDDPKVSSLHCLLLRVDDGVRVLDLQSRNGTQVNGARIKDIVLRRAATLTLGDARVWVRAEGTMSERVNLTSPLMRAVADIVRRIAPTDAPVMLLGECGVGKEGIAQELHRLSGRLGPLVPLNAAAITPTLAATELFGHVQGAFTGADHDRQGAFAAADGGTLFLDEIAELPLPVQAELLRAVEQRCIRRVGDHRELPVTARLVAATNRNLAEEVRAGRFREDLFHRVCVIPITVPPLRDRPDDVEALVHHFLGRETPPRRLNEAARALVRAYRWPGNVRELANVLRRAAVLSDHEELRPEDLHLSVRPATPLDELIHDRVMETYDARRQSVADTARALGMRRTAVYQHLKVANKRRTTVSAGRPSGSTPGQRPTR
jgi:transcriptional regulator with AAA-type ATPase domain